MIKLGNIPKAMGAIINLTRNTFAYPRVFEYLKNESFERLPLDIQNQATAIAARRMTQDDAVKLLALVAPVTEDERCDNCGQAMAACTCPED